MKKGYQNIHQHLIEACKRGERKAQFEVYKLYAKAMYNVAFRILKNSVETEDIIQESFLKAFQKLNSFSGDVSFGAWLKKIVINASLDELRRKKLEFENIDDANFIDPEDDTYEEKPSEYDLKKVKEAILLLSDGYRIVLSLYLLEGYDHDEIAEIVGVSASTSRSQLARAKKKLLEIIKKV
ncbi:MAG: sigma-70 family RNA polymerase sigma factor [Bacteroidota bacterium]